VVPVRPTRSIEVNTVMAETFLSQEAYDRLTAELEDLKTNGRPQISAEIEVARAHGDLRENAEYHAAKDEQGRMEARIRQIESLLQDAVIGERTTADDVAAGVVVTLEVAGDEETYLVGSREDRHPEFDVLSSDSPMGRALLGAKEGDSRGFETPAGATIDVRVISIRLP
jgi:transcription elongation factor GreA